MKTYTLTVTETQAEIIAAALDFYARIGCGQFQVIGELFPVPRKESGLSINTYIHEVWHNTYYQKQLFFGGKEVGITSAENRFKTAFDIFQVIRHRVSWDRKPEGGITVNFGEPFQVNHDEPLATMYEIERTGGRHG